jgi:hypothetical protein
MSSDFRITYAKGKSDDPEMQKQIVLFRRDWAALVSFAGVAETHSVKTSDWLVEQTAKLPLDAEFEDLERTLLSADSWLYRLRKDRFLTFSVAGFVFGRPIAMCISNYQTIDGDMLAAAEPALFSTKEDVKIPRISLAGQPSAVRESDLKMLGGVVQSAWNPYEVHRALARANKRAAQLDDRISETCFTAHLMSDGTAAAVPHGVRSDIEYIPASLRKLYGETGIILDSIIKPKVDTNGRPLPRRLKGMTAARQIEANKLRLARPVGVEAGDLLVAGIYSELGGWMFAFENVIAPPQQKEAARATVIAGIDKLTNRLHNEALNLFDFAIRQDHENAEAHLQRGIVLMHLAEEAFREAAKWGPELETVKQWLRRCREALGSGE